MDEGDLMFQSGFVVPESGFGIFFQLSLDWIIWRAAEAVRLQTWA